MPPAARPIFLVGSPWSGASLLALSLGQHQDIAAQLDGRWIAAISGIVRSVCQIVEPPGTEMDPTSIGIDRLESSANAGNAIYSLLSGCDALGNGFQSVFTPAEERGLPRHRVRWLIANPEFSFTIPGLLQLFPGAKFVHVVQDLDRVLHACERLPVGSGHYFTQDLIHEYWCRTVAASLEGERAYGSSVVRRVYYADLQRRPESVLHDCLEFLDVPFSHACLRPFNGLAVDQQPAPGLYRTGGPNGAAAKRLSRELSEASDVRYATNVGRIIKLEEKYLKQACNGLGSPRYSSFNERLRQFMLASVPEGAKLIVVSRGDEDLLRLGERVAWHFPQAEDGSYAGCYPANAREAIDHLEVLHERGASFFVLPATGFWWLEHYTAFREHLAARYMVTAFEERTGLIIDLRRRSDPGQGSAAFPSLLAAGREAAIPIHEPSER